MSRVRHIALAVAWLLPRSTVKNRILTRLGHRVHPSARVRPNLVWKVGEFEVGPDARLGLGNVFKNLRWVRLGHAAQIGRLNLVSAHPVFARHYPESSSLELLASAKITSRHQLDCSGGVSLGEFSSLAGHQTRIMSHSIDVRRNAQVAYPVLVGPRSFVGTRCVLLGGAKVPPRSMVAAGSVVPSQRETGPSGLWAGAPARFVREMEGAWFDRSETNTSDLYVPALDETIKGVI